VQANELFVHLPEPLIERLAARSMTFYRWGKPTPETHRLVTAWDTDPAAVDRVLAATAEVASVNIR